MDDITYWKNLASMAYRRLIEQNNEIAAAVIKNGTMDIWLDSHDNWNGGIDYWTIVFILEYRGRIQLDIYGEGQNMLSLFDKARNHVQCSSNVYKHVWIVYDTDDFPQKHINRTAELCEQSSTEETEYTQFGQISVLNYGFCYISAIFSRIFIEKNIGLNLVSA